MNNTVRLSKLESVRKSLDILTSFVTPALPFINGHNVDYFVKSYWNQFLPEKLREDLEALPVSSKLLKSYVDSLSSGAWRNAEKSLRADITFHNCTLHELVQKVGEFGLENMKMSIPLEEIPLLHSGEGEDKVTIKLDVDETETELQFDKFMSAKKMHEVEIMGHLVYRVAKTAGTRRRKASCQDEQEKVDKGDLDGKPLQIREVIDFGSGKGYLSSFLALLYKFNVIALDSSSGNTTAATERGERLQKVWQNLLRRASERARTGNCVSTRRKARRNFKNEDSESMLNVEENVGQGNPLDGKLVNLHLLVHKNLDLDQLIRKTQSPSFLVIKDSGFGIVGLHTCGSLGVDSIHLFLGNENALFLCNVPCCYHHVEEMVFPSTILEVNSPHSRLSKVNPRQRCFWAAEDAALTPEPGFPLSQYLQGKEFNLGRNARMLSSYTHERMSKELETTLAVDMPLVWRLLLQVIINEKQGHTLLDYQVGKLGKSCSTFQEYVYRALKKLHLNEIQIAPEEIDQVYLRYEPYFERFHCYYIIRTMLAPLVESCILLDRLAFLLEQESIVKEAFLVKVFDQFMSPRAHAIVAFKSTKCYEKELGAEMLANEKQ